jgi:class 3 adenylate cyclase/tetratricopeptide (TPR) repeat protein
MLTCSSCARECPDDFAFCPGCGTKLLAEPSDQAAAAPFPEERKVVTTLFCDLISFTAHSEASDHELIDALLQRYNEAAKRLVDAHGGVVEKYIGDAVVAVFGFPRAHDDDAERAVRCAFKLVDDVGKLLWPDGDPVQVHIGVNSGEIYLHTDVDPSSGQSFLTGDAVNTAARLEAASPANGVVVGALTHELTKHAAVYDELTPLTVKGKKEPVKAWQARQLVETSDRTGLRTTGSADTLFVGRDVELKKLVAAFDRAVNSQAGRFVLLVGEPGIGKSRLVLEFARTLDERGRLAPSPLDVAQPEVITWRQGRCAAYGDGSGLAALSDILKAHAGIFDSDDVATVEAKLETVLPETEIRGWMRQRLRPLVGLPATSASREENFTAWTRFIEDIASGGPTVLVFEDLHWASEGLLAFLQHLATQQFVTPILVLATTRPELLSRHADLLSSSATASRLTLAPLTQTAISRLMTDLLPVDLPPAIRDAVLQKAGGNPLYAEEYVRLLLDQGMLLRTDGRLRLREGVELPLPASVHAVLVARVDTLPRSCKSVLCDAAVLGETSWEGALVALSAGEHDAVRSALQVLVERQLLRHAASSSLVDERGYLFWHALVRDVAYAVLPKRTRVRKHVIAAKWIESTARDRVGDAAQVLAHHYVTGLELAEELKDAQLRESLTAPSLRFLQLAGDVALNLDTRDALWNFTRALEIAADDAPERSWILTQSARTLLLLGHEGEAASQLEEAIPGLLAAGEHRRAANALGCLSATLWALGNPEILAKCQEAVDLLEGDAPSPDMVYVYTNISITEQNFGRPERAKEFAERAVAAAERLYETGHDTSDLDTRYGGALDARGGVRCMLGDLGGLDDLQKADEIAIRIGDPEVLLYHAQASVRTEGPLSTIRIAERCIAFAEQLGERYTGTVARGQLASAQMLAGHWREAEAALGQAIDDGVASDDVTLLMTHKMDLAVLLIRRGEIRSAAALVEWSLEHAAQLGVPDYLASASISAAALELQTQPDRARAYLEQALRALDDEGAYACYWLTYELPDALRAAGACESLELLEAFTERIVPRTPILSCARAYGDALMAKARGRHDAAAAGFADTAARWHGFGVPYEEAQALLGQGRCLGALGRAPEAAAVLEQAREVFARLGAKPALEESEMLLAHLGAATQ